MIFQTSHPNASRFAPFVVSIFVGIGMNILASSAQGHFFLPVQENKATKKKQEDMTVEQAKKLLAKSTRLMGTGKLLEAEKSTQHAYDEISEKRGRLDKYTLNALSLLTQIKFVLRRSEAIRHAEDLAKRSRSTGIYRTQRYFTNIGMLAFVYMTFGQFEKAEQVYQQCSREDMSKFPVSEFSFRFTYTEHLIKIDRLNDAQQQLELANNIAQKVYAKHRSKDKNATHFQFEDMVVLVQIRKSSLFNRMGEFEKATAISQPCLKRLESLSPKYARNFSQATPISAFKRDCHRNLAIAAFGKGNYRKAKKHYLLAEKLIVPSRHAAMAQTQKDVAATMLRLGELKQAEEKIASAIIEYKKATSHRDAMYSDILRVKSKIQRARGDAAGSLATIAEAIEIRNKKPIAAQLQHALDQVELGKSKLHLRQKQKAHQTFCKTLDGLLDYFDRELIFMSEGSALQYARTIKSVLNEVVASTDHRNPSQVEQAYQYSLRAKSPVTQIIARRQWLLRSGASEKTAEIKRQLAAVRTRQAEIRLNPNISEEESENLYDQKRKLIAKLVAASPKTANSELTSDRTDKMFQTLTESLPQSHVIVDLVELDQSRKPDGKPAKSSAAFVIGYDKSKKKWRTQLVFYDSKYLAKQVARSYIKSIYNKQLDVWRGWGLEGDTIIDTKSANRYLKELWTKIESCFPSHLNSQSVIHIIADGNLGRIPWSSVRNANGKYLVEKYCFSINDSADLMFRGATAKPPQSVNKFKQPVLVGAINYSNSTDAKEPNTRNPTFRTVISGNSNRFKNLPESEPEIDDIQKILGIAKTVTLKRSEANKSQFLKAFARCDLLHFSGHGYLLDQLSLKTTSQNDKRFAENIYSKAGIVLSKSETDALKDYLIFGEELVDRDLSTVQLVVLSGCFTGGGRYAINDGVWGIRKAMHLAGVRSTVTALYPVEDSSTRSLMKLFYQNLMKSETSKAQALAEAQRSLIKQKKEPRFWTAWTLSGDWR